MGHALQRAASTPRGTFLLFYKQRKSSRETSTETRPEKRKKLQKETSKKNSKKNTQKDHQQTQTAHYPESGQQNQNSITVTAQVHQVHPYIGNHQEVKQVQIPNMGMTSELAYKIQHKLGQGLSLKKQSPGTYDKGLKKKMIQKKIWPHIQLL